MEYSISIQTITKVTTFLNALQATAIKGKITKTSHVIRKHGVSTDILRGLVVKVYLEKTSLGKYKQGKPKGKNPKPVIEKIDRLKPKKITRKKRSFSFLWGLIKWGVIMKRLFSYFKRKLKKRANREAWMKSQIITNKLN